MKTLIQRGRAPSTHGAIAPCQGERETWVRAIRQRGLIPSLRLALLICSLALWLGPGPRAGATASTDAAGYVYVLNNDLSGANSLTVFGRSPRGALTLLGTTPIGGLGSVTAFADGTQGSLILAANGARLFAVDAGSDQISVVNVAAGQLSPAGVFPSGGAGPVSLSYRHGLLYVLNAANTSQTAANVAGFHVDAAGVLHPIAGATRPLSAPHPNPAQVQIDPSGHFVLVTEKGTNLLDVYQIQRDGSLNGPTTVPSVGAVPFGLAFTRLDRQDEESDVATAARGPNDAIADSDKRDAGGEEFLVADAAGGANGTGAATAYRLAQGTVRLLNGPVPDFQIAPCWMVITKNGRFAYTSNADSHVISGYRLDENGALSLLDAQGVTAATPADTFPLEEALSRHSRFLYVLDSRLLLTPPGPATLSGFQIGDDGRLTAVVDPVQVTLPVSAIGLAAE